VAGVTKALKSRELRVQKTSTLYAAVARGRTTIDPFAKGFAELMDYVEELASLNPGSSVVIETSTTGTDKQFFRFFASFAVQGALTGVCASILSLDCGHMKHDGWSQYRYVDSLSINEG
jgi:hypothetical protein